MEEWKEYKLGDITMMKNGKKRPQTNGRYPVFGGNGIMDYSNDFNSERVIIVGRVGAYCGCVYKSEEKCWVSDNAIAVFPKEDVDFLFLYYLMNTLDFHYHHIGGAQPLMTQDIIGNFNIKLPSLKIQQHIASILKSLDDKIEVNRKINENLEQQAQALFKSWFVDFEPFKNGEFVESELGMIPKGWRVGTLGEYCKVRSGFAFKSTWWTNEGVPVIKIKNITDNGNLEMLDCSFVSKEHAALAKEFQTIEGDLLIAMTGATIGKFCIVHDNSKYCVNQRVGKFFLGDEPFKKLPFIFLNLKQSSVHDEIINRGQGSAQPNISGGDIETLKVVIAPDVVISNFNVMLYPSFKKMISNQQESRRLAELRDTLLPKLMSGELKVCDIVL